MRNKEHSTSLTSTLDSWITRLLLIRPQPAPTAAATAVPGERVLSISMIFSAIRCTLQYIVLPFLLPWIGLSGNLSFGITMVLDLAALVLVTMSLRSLWKSRHPRRWTFLPLAVVALVLIVSLVGYDIYTLLA